MQQSMIESVISSDDTMGLSNDGFSAEILSDSNALPTSNLGYKQIVTLKAFKKKKSHVFKVDVHVESYEAQSHAYLFVLNKNNEWTLLESLNPQKHFNLDWNSLNKNKEAFVPIFAHFGNSIKDIFEVLN